eukprot:TRINITY_DN6150_c0_g5_i1.p1 TRINITY_DN6150_c0_g5~~TRINITY_DN6150_c0_g5_i1.p1  ORF type:complete len:613 (+),score=120.64 TRINITY_DN6150_c0_g5_i1:205-2043(+)
MATQIQDRLLPYVGVLSPVYHALYLSKSADDTAGLITALSSGSDPNEIYHRHVPLHSAIHKKSIPMIDALLSVNASPFTRPLNHFSPFQLAVYLEILEPNDLHISMWDKLTRTIWEPHIHHIPIVPIEGPPGPKQYTPPNNTKPSLRDYFLNRCDFSVSDLYSYFLFVMTLEKDEKPYSQKSLAFRVKTGINLPVYCLNSSINKPRSFTRNFLYEKHIPYFDFGLADQPLAGKLECLTEPWTIQQIVTSDSELRKLYTISVLDCILGFPHMFLDEFYSKIFSTLLTGFKDTLVPKLSDDHSAMALGGILCNLWKEVSFGHLLMRVVTIITLPINCDVFINEELPNVRKAFEEMFEFFRDNLHAMDFIIRQYLFIYESFSKALRESCPTTEDPGRLYKFQQSVFGPIRATGVVFIYKFNQLVSESAALEKHAYMQSINDSLYKLRGFADRFSLLTEVITHNPELMDKVDKRDLFFYLASELNQKLFCYRGKRGLIYTDPETPLFIAAKKKDVSTCVELLTAGAYPFTVDNEGKMFFDMFDSATQEVKDFLETCPAISKPYPLKTLCAQLYLKERGLDGLRLLRPQRNLYEFVMLHVRCFKNEEEYQEFTMVNK